MPGVFHDFQAVGPVFIPLFRQQEQAFLPLPEPAPESGNGAIDRELVKMGRPPAFQPRKIPDPRGLVRILRPRTHSGWRIWIPAAVEAIARVHRSGNQHIIRFLPRGILQRYPDGDFPGGSLGSR